jgi:hypothetical protein
VFAHAHWFPSSDTTNRQGPHRGQQAILADRLASRSVLWSHLFHLFHRGWRPAAPAAAGGGAHHAFPSRRWPRRGVPRPPPCSRRRRRQRQRQEEEGEEEGSASGHGRSHRGGGGLCRRNRGPVDGHNVGVVMGVGVVVGGAALGEC